MNSIVRDALIEFAKKEEKGSTITYQALADRCNLKLIMTITPQMRVLAKILVEIAEFEEAEKRPMLTALVKSVYSRIPGKGFYELADRFEKFSFTEDKNKKKEFFNKELYKVYDYWKQ